MLMDRSAVTRTSGTALRELLRTYEISVADPSGKGQKVLDIFRLRDDIEEAASKLQADNVDIRPELSRLETADANLKSNTGKIVKELKASGGLAAGRSTINPPQERWWWYIDEALAARNKAKYTRIGIIGGAVVVLAVALFIIVDRAAGPPQNFRDALKHIGKAESYIMEKNYDAAITEYESAATLTPPETRITPVAEVAGTPQTFTYAYANADPQIYLAALYKIKGRPEEARAMEEAAETVMGKREYVIESIAQAFYNMGEIDHAADKVEELLAINPESARAYYIRGGIYEAREEYAQALEDFKKSGDLAVEQYQSQLYAMAQTRYVNLLKRMEVTAP